MLVSFQTNLTREKAAGKTAVFFFTKIFYKKIKKGIYFLNDIVYTLITGNDTTVFEGKEKRLMKAKFIGKYYRTSWDFSRDVIELEYEYRGIRYSVFEDRKKGNEPLSWQHKSEQAMIDRMLDTPKTSGAGKPFDMDEVFDLLEMDFSVKEYQKKVEKGTN